MGGHEAVAEINATMFDGLSAISDRGLRNYQYYFRGSLL